MQDHEIRRKIIREWMALPKDKRQTEEQVAAFAPKFLIRVSPTAMELVLLYRLFGEPTQVRYVPRPELHRGGC